MTGVLFPASHFKNDTSTKPKGRLVVHPTDATVEYLLKVRAAMIAGLVDTGIRMKELPGPWKSKHKKEFNACSDRAAKIKFLTGLADMDESPVINFPLKKDAACSTSTKTIWSLSANHNIIKPNAGDERAPARPEFGADVNNWLDSHHGDMVDVPTPTDLSGEPILWSTIRENKPDHVPVNFTGVIREFGISPQGINKDAGGKLFCNSFFDKTMQFASYEKSEGAAASCPDVSHFFAQE